MAIFTGLAAAIGGLLSSTFLSGTIGAALLRVAIGVGLNLLAQALAGKQKQAEASGVKGKLQAGGDIARSLILGLTATAGSLVYANTWGEAHKTPNAYFTQVVSLADHPIREVSGLWVNGQPVTVDTSGIETEKGWPVTEYRSDSGSDYLWIKWYDGTQTAADPFLTSSVSSTGRPWHATRVGAGVAYAIVTSRANPTLFTGFPQFRFEIKGRKLYDISKDSTAGGLGTHRWSNRSTWGGDGDDLPAVQVYNLLRGIYENGTWLYGLQTVTAPRLPAADWIAQVDKCRLEPDGAGNGAQYLTGGEIAVNATIGDTIERVLTGCQGRVIETAGVYKLRMGDPGEAVIPTISDDDILSTEEQTFTPFFGLAETINGVTATYMEPGEAWNTKAAPPLYNAAYEVQDGSRRLMTSVDMNMVYRSIQVQRIMTAALKEARRARRHTLALPPRFQALEPGDVIPWTSARNNYATKLFRIDGVADKANLDVVVDMTEVDPTDYDPDIDYIPPVFSPQGPIVPPPQEMTGWDADPYTIEEGGKQLPSIQVFYDGDLDDVQSVRVQARFAGDTAIQFDGTVPYGDPATNADPSSVVLHGSFLPDTDYEVRGIFLPFSGRATDWSAWIAVTTPDAWINDVYPIDLDRLADDVKDYHAWIGNSVRDVLDELRAVSSWASNQELSNFSDKQQLRTELRSESDGVLAIATDLITVATGPTSALSQRITTLEVTIPTLATASAVSALSTRVSTAEGTISSQGSSIIALQNAVNDPSTGLAANATAVSSLSTAVASQGTAITANATAITALNSAVGDVSAGTLFKAESYASPGGGWARLGLQARASTSASFASASIFLDAKSSGESRIVLDASELFFGDLSSGAIVNPLVYSGGVWAMNVANIGTVTAGLLQNAAGTMVINLTSGFISIKVP